MKAFKIVAVVVLIAFFVLFLSEGSLAQCAMCKGAISDKANNGDSDFGAGLNKGILYLMAFPYMIFGAIAFFWYKESKKSSGKSSKVFDILKSRFRA